jgi:hypothetical protein
MSWCGGGEISVTPRRSSGAPGRSPRRPCARELPPLAGLGALGHLDLDLVGVDQVVRRHAEAPRGHLLDRAAPGVPVGVGLKRSGSSPPSPVLLGRRCGSSRRRGLVGLLRDAPEAHRARSRSASRSPPRAPPRRGAPGLPARGASPHSAAQREQPGASCSLTASPTRRRSAGVVVAHRALQPATVLGRPQVRSPPCAGVHDPPTSRPPRGAGRRRGRGGRGASRAISPSPTPRMPRRGPGEVLGRHGLVDADGLEDLRALVRRHVADPHLGHHLLEPLHQAFT